MDPAVLPIRAQESCKMLYTIIRCPDITKNMSSWRCNWEFRTGTGNGKVTLLVMRNAGVLSVGAISTIAIANVKL
jgi:hypothetical protein